MSRRYLEAMTHLVMVYVSPVFIYSFFFFRAIEDPKESQEEVATLDQW